MKRQSPINIEVDDTRHNDRLSDIDIIDEEDDEEKRMYLFNNGHSGNHFDHQDQENAHKPNGEFLRTRTNGDILGPFGRTKGSEKSI